MQIETKYFFVLGLQEKKVSRLCYCLTKSKLADVLTKPLQRVRLEKLTIGSKDGVSLLFS